MNGNEEGILASYRVLDLTEGGCMFGGKILADLGADVIKVEKPGGSPSRNVGPFYKNKSGIDRSLSWFAYNTNKRGITLDLESARGRDIFKQLVKSADILMESSSGSKHLGKLHLGYAVLSQLNPKIIMVSITPFGLTGPKAKFLASDLTIWASSGMLSLAGEENGPPTWVSYPQASLHGGGQAALASLIALWNRHLTGVGQHVDVSLQAACIRPTMNIVQNWDMARFIVKRHTPYIYSTETKARFRVGYRCKDGFIGTAIHGGLSLGPVRSSQRLVEWMDEEGMAPEWLKEFDWVHDFDIAKIIQNDVDRIEGVIASFFKLKTKAQIIEQAFKRGIFIAPAFDIKEVCESRQLEARGFWGKVEHENLDDVITYCGALAKISDPPLKIRRIAPCVGEDNEEIYCGELGLSPEEITELQQANVL